MQPSSRTFWTMRGVAFVLGKHEVTRGVGNFLFVQMSNRMPISVQGYVTLELHLRSVGLVHDESFAWPQHYVFIPQCGFSRNSAKVIGFGNKPLFQKKRESCTKQLKRFSGVSPGCQDSLAASERFCVCAAQAIAGGIGTSLLRMPEQGCAGADLAHSRTTVHDHHQSQLTHPIKNHFCRLNSPWLP